MPRKMLPEQEKRNERFNVYANQAEASLIREKAKKSGLSATAFLRVAGSGKQLREVVPQVNLETWRTLGFIATSIGIVIRNLDEVYGENLNSEQLEAIKKAIQKLRLNIVSGEPKQQSE